MRIALTVLMTIAQLAGPWLCCCGRDRVLAAVSSRFTEIAPAQDAGGCPHCKNESPRPKPTEPPLSPPCGPDRCPCGGMQAVVVPADKPETQVVADLFGLLTVALPEPVGIRSVTVQSVPGLRTVPHLTTADRLYTHHVLRC